LAWKNAKQNGPEDEVEVRQRIDDVIKGRGMKHDNDHNAVDVCSKSLC
jgi:hypothetical protein